MENPDNRHNAAPGGFDSEGDSPDGASYAAPIPSPDSAAASKRSSLLESLYRKFRPLAAAGALFASELPNQAEAADAPGGGQAQEQVLRGEARYAELANWSSELGVTGLTFARGPMRSISENVSVIFNGENIGFVVAKRLRLVKPELVLAVAPMLQEKGVKLDEKVLEKARAEAVEADVAAAADRNKALTKSLASLGVPGLEVRAAVGDDALKDDRGIFVDGRHIGNISLKSADTHDLREMAVIKLLRKAGIPFK